MVTLRQVFESPDLRGVYGLIPVRKTFPNACGACCVATALRHLGTPVTEQNCVDALGTNAAIGSDPVTILRYVAEKRFNAYAFTGYPLRKVLEHVLSQHLVLIRWGDRPDHWNIVVGTEPVLNQVVLLDPAGRPLFTTLSLDEFEALWHESPQLALVIARPARTDAKRSKNKRDYRVRPYRTLIAGKKVVVST